MKVLTGFAVVTDSVGKRIAYTYSVVNESGIIVESNKKESFVVISPEEKAIITSLENIINTRLAK